MSNEFEKNQGRDDAGHSANSVVRLFGQMVMLPLTVFVYGMELFVRTIQGMQRVADDGMDVVVGRTDQTSPALSASKSQSANFETGNEGFQAASILQGNLSDSANQAVTSKNDSAIGVVVETNQEERIKMSDTDLSGDQLKLVRYKILFVKRDYEVAFPEREELVHDNLTGEAFTAWKVAEFIQRLDREEVPEKWRKKNYPRKCRDKDDGEYEKDGEECERDEGKYWKKEYIKWLDEEDKKYLRVYYEVLARYDREEANYERDQVEVLKEIRNRL